MTRYRGIGKSGMAISIVATLAMCSVAFLLHPEQRLSGELGICLPSPNLWKINPVSSWLINTVLLGGIAAGAFFLNRTHNFIRSTQPVLPALFLVLAASNPWATGYLSSSTLLCAVNLLSLSVLFRAYNSPNATQELFVVGTFLSVGSMFQYAFLPMVPAYVAGAVMMKSFRIKEALAMGMGLMAPYWVGVGMGIIPPEAFSVPQLTNLFNDFAHVSNLFVFMISVGVAAFAAILLGLNNAMKLYAGNSRVNAQNMCISFVGVVCIICIVVDFSNMMAYVDTLYFTAAVQVANLCALWHFKREWIIVAVPALLYIIFFIVMLFT